VRVRRRLFTCQSCQRRVLEVVCGTWKICIAHYELRRSQYTQFFPVWLAVYIPCNTRPHRLPLCRVSDGIVTRTSKKWYSKEKATCHARSCT
jgi:hypothetical protein